MTGLCRSVRNALPGFILLLGLAPAAGTAADNTVSFEDGGSMIVFDLPSNYCLIDRDEPDLGEFLWKIAEQASPARGDLMSVAMDCDTREAIIDEGMSGAFNSNAFRLAAVLVVDGSRAGTRAELIEGIEAHFDPEMSPYGEASFLGSDDYGAYIQVEIDKNGDNFVDVGGVTMVDGVVVSVEFLTFNQGSLTRNRLLSDAETTMRRLVDDNGTEADLTGHSRFTGVLLLVLIAGGIAVAVIVGFLIWSNRSAGGAPRAGDDVWGESASKPKPVERQGGGFGRRTGRSPK